MSEPRYSHRFTKQSFDWMVDLYEDRIEFYNGEGTRLYASVPFCELLGVDYDEMEGMGGSLCIRSIGGVRSEFSFVEEERDIAEEYIGFILDNALKYTPLFALSVNNDCEVRYDENYFAQGRPDFYVNDFGSVCIFALGKEELVYCKDTTFDKGVHIAYADIADLSFEEVKQSEQYSRYTFAFTVKGEKYEVWVDKKNLSEMRACFKALTTLVRMHKNKVDERGRDRKEVFVLTDARGMVYEFSEDNIIERATEELHGATYEHIVNYDDIHMYYITESSVDKGQPICFLYKKGSCKPEFQVRLGIEFVEAVERFTDRKLIHKDDYIEKTYGPRGEVIGKESYVVFYENYLIEGDSTFSVIRYEDIVFLAKHTDFPNPFDRYSAYFADIDLRIGVREKNETYFRQCSMNKRDRNRLCRKLEKILKERGICYYFAPRAGKAHLKNAKEKAKNVYAFFNGYVMEIVTFDTDALFDEDFSLTPMEAREVKYSGIRSVVEVKDKDNEYLLVDDSERLLGVRLISGRGGAKMRRLVKREIEKRIKKKS